MFRIARNHPKKYLVCQKPLKAYSGNVSLQRHLAPFSENFDCLQKESEWDGSCQPPDCVLRNASAEKKQKFSCNLTNVKILQNEDAFISQLFQYLNILNISTFSRFPTSQLPSTFWYCQYIAFAPIPMTKSMFFIHLFFKLQFFPSFNILNLQKWHYFKCLKPAYPPNLLLCRRAPDRLTDRAVSRSAALISPAPPCSFFWLVKFCWFPC